MVQAYFRLDLYLGLQLTFIPLNFFVEENFDHLYICPCFLNTGADICDAN